MLRALLDKVAASMQGQLGNASRETQILRKNQKEMLQIKNPVPDMVGLLVDGTRLRKEPLS